MSSLGMIQCNLKRKYVNKCYKRKKIIGKIYFHPEFPIQDESRSLLSLLQSAVEMQIAKRDVKGCTLIGKNLGLYLRESQANHDHIKIHREGPTSGNRMDITIGYVLGNICLECVHTAFGVRVFLLS